MMYEFTFPDVGEGIHEGKILELRFNPGDRIDVGDILAVVETDKVVAEIPSPKAGILQKYGAEVDAIIKVGATLAHIQIGGAAADEAATEDTAPVETKEEAAATTIMGELRESESDILPPSTEGMTEAAEPRKPDTRSIPKATPVARRLAQELGINLASIKGSGPGGRIQKSDVISFSETGDGQNKVKTGTPYNVPLTDDPLAATHGPPIGQNVELTILRKSIAYNMELSRKIPTAVVHDYGIVNDLVDLRRKVNEGREPRFSFQPFFMKAVATALRRHPVLNASFNPLTEEVILYSDINIGFAVNTDAGLLLPVIRTVEQKTIQEIDSEMKRYVGLAKKRTIPIENMRGGTISLTNFGSFGGVYASPMIYPPQVAIIAIGRIHQAPVVENGKLEPAWVLPVSLAFDHRVVDGVPAASFVSYVLQLLREPQELFVSM
jgi:pyruvate dehydrogenase E2 component (dihydrolipoamide acetyltransferase)